MMKSELVVKASLLGCQLIQISLFCCRCKGENLPADPVLLLLPVLALLAVEHAGGVLDVLLELWRRLPLRVVLGSRGRGKPPARQNLPDIGKDLLTPPLELLVLCWRQAANEWACSWS